MKKSIGYHTRLDGVKLTEGSFGGSAGGAFTLETVNRLVNNMFTIEVINGRPVLVDREFRKVRLYISVDPIETEAGKAAMKEYRRVQAEIEAEQEKLERAQLSTIEDLMSSMSHEEIITRLTKE